MYIYILYIYIYIYIYLIFQYFFFFKVKFIFVRFYAVFADHFSVNSFCLICNYIFSFSISEIAFKKVIIT